MSDETMSATLNSRSSGRLAKTPPSTHSEMALALPSVPNSLNSSPALRSSPRRAAAAAAAAAASAPSASIGSQLHTNTDSSAGGPGSGPSSSLSSGSRSKSGTRSSSRFNFGISSTSVSGNSISGREFAFGGSSAAPTPASLLMSATNAAAATLSNLNSNGTLGGFPDQIVFTPANSGNFGPPSVSALARTTIDPLSVSIGSNADALSLPMETDFATSPSHSSSAPLHHLRITPVPATGQITSASTTGLVSTATIGISPFTSPYPTRRSTALGHASPVPFPSPSISTALPSTRHHLSVGGTNISAPLASSPLALSGFNTAAADSPAGLRPAAFSFISPQNSRGRTQRVGSGVTGASPTARIVGMSPAPTPSAASDSLLPTPSPLNANAFVPPTTPREINLTTPSAASQALQGQTPAAAPPATFTPSQSVRAKVVSAGNPASLAAVPAASSSHSINSGSVHRPLPRYPGSEGKRRSVHAFPHVPDGDRSIYYHKPCNCKKSRCLKLYCECFARQDFCGPHCRCQNCANCEATKDLRDSTMNAIIERDPTAFFRMKESKILDNLNKHPKGCSCKKSGCQKKYCECYQAGVSCTDACKCSTCKNGKVVTAAMLEALAKKKKYKKHKKKSSEDEDDDDNNGHIRNTMDMSLTASSSAGGTADDEEQDGEEEYGEDKEFTDDDDDDDANGADEDDDDADDQAAANSRTAAQRRSSGSKKGAQSSGKRKRGGLVIAASQSQSGVVYSAPTVLPAGMFVQSSHLPASLHQLNVSTAIDSFAAPATLFDPSNANTPSRSLRSSQHQFQQNNQNPQFVRFPSLTSPASRTRMEITAAVAAVSAAAAAQANLAAVNPTTYQPAAAFLSTSGALNAAPNVAFANASASGGALNSPAQKRHAARLSADSPSSVSSARALRTSPRARNRLSASK